MKKLLFCLALLLMASCLFTAAMAAGMTYQEIVDLAYTLEKGQILPDTYRLYGRVISVDTPYSYKYDNVTVTIAVEGREDKPIYCYRLEGPGAPEIYEGSWITVEGKLKNYKDVIEFDKGCRLLSCIHEVLPGLNVNIEASFDKEAAVIGQPVTLSFTISECIDNYLAYLTRRVYDAENGTVYTTQSIYIDRYGDEVTFTPRFGTRLEYDIRLFLNGEQRYSYPISIPITGAQADAAPSVTLTNYSTSAVLGEPVSVTVKTTGYMPTNWGRWYVDTGSGFISLDSEKVYNNNVVTFTPTSGTRLYYEVESETEAGVLITRTSIIPITNGFPVVPGDVNSDAKLDLQDVLTLLQYCAGWDVTPDPLTADVNGDWTVDVNDALAILEQLSAR